MLARGKLVGVIDLQSTRLDAYSRAGSRSLPIDRHAASRVAIDNARLYRRVDRQNRTLKTLSHFSQEFSSILDMDELLQQDRRHDRCALVSFRRFQHSSGGRGAQNVLRHRFSQRYDQRVNFDNIRIGKGLTGQRRRIARDRCASPIR